MNKLSAVSKTRKESEDPSSYRRSIALLSTIGLIDFIPITLYQLGIIKHLPDIDNDLFNSDYVNASDEAQIAGVPDGPLSLLSYAANLALVTGGIRLKTPRNAADRLMAVNSIGQAAGGAFYLFNMITKQKKICLYCVTGALINFLSLIPLYKLFFAKK